MFEQEKITKGNNQIITKSKMYDLEYRLEKATGLIFDIRPYKFEGKTYYSLEVPVNQKYKTVIPINWSGSPQTLADIIHLLKSLLAFIEVMNDKEKIAQERHNSTSFVKAPVIQEVKA